jgi:hypothetical protein
MFAEAAIKQRPDSLGSRTCSFGLFYQKIERVVGILGFGRKAKENGLKAGFQNPTL